MTAALPLRAFSVARKNISINMRFTNDFVLPIGDAADGPKKGSTDTFAAAYNSHGGVLCVGGFDGAVRTFVTAHHPYRPANFTLTVATAGGAALTSAITTMQFRPEVPGAARNVLLVGCSDGNVSHWHMGGQKLLHTATEPDNEVYAAAYCPDGKSYVTAGKDMDIRLYDEDRHALKATLVTGSDGVDRAHTSRINSLRWLDHNTLVSAGWDRTVQVWDVRAARSQRYMYGPYVCGNGVDVLADGKTLVVGSTRTEEQLELWDLGEAKRNRVVPWPKEPRANDPNAGEYVPTNVFSVEVSPDGKWVAAGGSTDFRVFDADALPTCKTADTAVVGELVEGGGSPHAVFGVAWSASSEHVVACGATTTILSTQRGLHE